MTAGDKVRCNTCGHTIQSMHRHDFRGCGCDPDAPTWIAVDGGADYLRMVAGSLADYTVLAKPTTEVTDV